MLCTGIRIPATFSEFVFECFFLGGGEWLETDYLDVRHPATYFLVLN
jgi:hypothetical protein